MTKIKFKFQHMIDAAKAQKWDFGTSETDKGVLNFMDDLAVGEFVWFEEDGKQVTPPDGDYIAGDKVVKVEKGVITEIADKTEESEPAGDPAHTGMAEGDPAGEPTGEPASTTEVTPEMFDTLNNAIQELQKSFGDLVKKVESLTETGEKAAGEVETLKADFKNALSKSGKAKLVSPVVDDTEVEKFEYPDNFKKKK